MNKDKLKNIIELVVEEVKQLNEIFINEEKEISLKTISKPNLKRLSKNQKQYTKNKMLNEVLNNTKPLGSQEQETIQHWVVY